MKEVNPMETSERLSATRVIPLGVAIENPRLAMKRRLLTVLTVVITLFVLISSLAAWPSVERMLLVKIREAIIESANHEKLPLNLSLGTRTSVYEEVGFQGPCVLRSGKVGTLLRDEACQNIQRSYFPISNEGRQDIEEVSCEKKDVCQTVSWDHSSDLHERLKRSSGRG